MTAPPTIDMSTGELIRANTTILAQEAAALTHAVDTAKRYPRSVTKFKAEMREWACLDKPTALSCIYSLPRGGSSIIGPSARFGELVACSWGNISVQTRVIGEDEGFVVVEGGALDAEKNVSRRDQVRRSILDKNGKRFPQHLVETTIAATREIAARNATLKVVPRAIWEPIFNEVRRLGAGEGKTMAEKRTETARYLTENLGVPIERVYTTLSGRRMDDWSLDDVIALNAKARLIYEQASTIDAQFPERLEKDPEPARDSRDAASAAIAGLKTPEEDRPAEESTEPQTSAPESVDPCLQQDDTGARCVAKGPHQHHVNKEGLWEKDGTPAKSEPNVTEPGEPDLFE